MTFVDSSGSVECLMFGDVAEEFFGIEVNYFFFHFRFHLNFLLKKIGKRLPKTFTGRKR